MASAHPFRAADFFVLRAPFLPFRVLTDWGAGLALQSAADDDLTAAVAHDRALLVERLLTEVCKPQFREAIFCASPSLDAALNQWLRAPFDEASANVVPILVRYLTRMSARSTPFGLFSSCGVGRVGNERTTLLIAEVVRHTRLDMQYLTALVHALESEPEIRSALRFFPSAGLYRRGAQVQHAEAELRGEPKARAYRLVSFDATAGLEVALRRATTGAFPKEIVAALLESHGKVDADSARAFVEELIDSQVLVSELAPPITGPEPVHHVIAVLRERGTAEEAATALEAVRELIATLDREGVGQSDVAYRAIAKTLEALPVPVEMSRLLQVDLIRGTGDSCLGADVTTEFQRGIELLQRIAVPVEPGELAKFASAFEARYEAREVPLCEALDEESGLGFGSSSPPSELLEGLTFPKKDTTSRVRWSARETWLAKRLVELERAGTSDWQLDARDIEALETRLEVPLPDSFAVSATVATESATALAAGDFQVLLHGIGEGGANMLGRFCHADPILHEAVRSHLAAEEALTPDTVFAEIVHQPEGRIGNILCRPVLRRYEIPYLARSGVDAEHQLSVEDLLVSVAPIEAFSSTRIRLRLRSKKLGCWVQPRMTHAHNPETSSLSVYRFLCAMRGPQADALPNWDWGPLRDAPHLPRVSFGRLILALEQWTLGPHEVDRLKELTGAARYHALRSLRTRLQLPRWVAVVDGDQVLPVDLQNVLSCDSFFRLVKPLPRVTLTEVFPAPDQLVVEGPEGRHSAEIVLPFLAVRAPSPARPIPVAPSVRRTFGPGSEWLYAKLYSGEATTDAVLRELIRPLVREATSSGAVDRWFFIRYADPHPHLRVRFHGSPERLMSQLGPALHGVIAPWLATGRVHRFELGTYEREVERYGGDQGVLLAESVFHADSDAALALIESLDGISDAEVRWRFAILGMDRLLSDLGFEIEARLGLLRGVRASFAAEHAVDTKLEREIGVRFRRLRPELEAWMDSAGASSSEGAAPGLAHFEARSKQLLPTMRQLRACAAAGELTVSLDDLAASFLHMHANRILVADHRTHELVLCDFLLRLYEGHIARARRGAGRLA
jgi:lantibiotic biosynthesis protein